MKKYALISCVALLVSQAVQAAPLVNGPYLAIKGGFDNMHFKSDEDKGNKTVFDVLIALGLRVKSFRAEVEWANLTKAHIKDNRYEQQRYMAQFYYDVPLRSAFRPYLNFGLGASYTELNYRDAVTSQSGDDTTFAWNAGAGIGINLSRSWSFDLGYRYVDTGKAKFYDDVTATNRNHEFYFGGRYTF